MPGKNNVPIDDASSVNNAQRHKRTRMQYKDIRANLDKARREKRGLHTVRDAIPQVEQTYTKVDRSNEAVIDSVIVAEMSTITAEETRRFELDSALSFNVDEYVKCLAAFMETSGPINTEPNSTYSADSGVSGLAKLGIMAFETSLRPPTSDFMIGPLAIERKVRSTGPRQRRVIDENVEKVAPMQLHLGDVKHGKKMTQIILEIYNTLVDTGATQSSPVGLFEFVLNPNSFSQSVENLFYLSFLVHDGKVTLNIDDFNVPVIAPQEPLPQDPVLRRAEEQRRAQAPARQMIFDLDQQTWRELCEAFDIPTSCIPNRDPEATREVDPDNPSWYS